MPFGGQWGHRLYLAFWKAVDWLYPPDCGGCNRRGVRWCSDCDTNVHRIDQHRLCSVCGQSLPVSGICRVCQRSRPVYTAARSWSIYEGSIRNAHHRLKYHRDIGLGDTFAKPLITLLNDAHWPIEMIVPVPVGIARMRERGYNQSAFIALPLALGVGLPYCPGALKRVRETRSQVDLSLAERKDNVKKAFQADRSLVKDRTVLIVDDVMTSGATLDSCAAALLEGGASQVYCLTLARAASQADSL